MNSPITLSSVHNKKMYPNVIIRAITKYLNNIGYKEENIFRNTNLSFGLVLNSPLAISCQDIIHVIENTIAITNIPSIGLLIGQSMRIPSLGVYGYALQSCASHIMALKLSSHYDQIVCPLALLENKRVGSQIVRTTEPLEEIPKNESVYRFIIELKFAAIAAAMEDLYGIRISFTKISLKYPNPGYEHEYERIFGCRATFSAAENSISFPASLLASQMRYPAPDANMELRKICDSIMERIGNPKKMTDIIKSILIETPGYFPTLEALAHELAMSPRTLRRRLKEENRTYSGILSETRKHLTTSYINMADMPIKQIANLLGYSSVNSFNEAFYRWFKDTPSNYRRKRFE